MRGFAPVTTVLAAAIGWALWMLLQQRGVAVASLADIATSPLLPPGLLVGFRAACATLAWYTLLSLYGNTVGFVFQYQRATVLLRHRTRLTTFTVWCFSLLALYFTLATACSLAVMLGQDGLLPAWLVTVTCILFEVSYPMSLLVSTVVTWVLIPAARQHHYPIERLFRWRPLVMHSGNVLMMQLAMLSAPPPVSLSHLPYALLFGCSYALFAAYWFRRTGVFYYYFLDYRRAGTVWTYLGLLATLALLYLLSYGIALLARHEASHYWASPCLLLLTLSLTRFRAPGTAPQSGVATSRA